MFASRIFSSVKRDYTCVFAWPWDNLAHAAEIIARFVDGVWVLVTEQPVLMPDRAFDLGRIKPVSLTPFDGGYRVLTNEGNKFKLPERSVTQVGTKDGVYTVCQITSLFQIREGISTYTVVGCFGYNAERGEIAIFNVDVDKLATVLSDFSIVPLLKEVIEKEESFSSPSYAPKLPLSSANKMLFDKKVDLWKTKHEEPYRPSSPSYEGGITEEEWKTQLAELETKKKVEIAALEAQIAYLEGEVQSSKDEVTKEELKEAINNLTFTLNSDKKEWVKVERNKIKLEEDTRIKLEQLKRNQEWIEERSKGLTREGISGKVIRVKKFKFVADPFNMDVENVQTLEPKKLLLNPEEIDIEGKRKWSVGTSARSTVATTREEVHPVDEEENYAGGSSATHIKRVDGSGDEREL